MSPFQHGEVFVTDDGAETDLDLGHYERFVDVPLTRRSNATTGSIYQSVLAKLDSPASFEGFKNWLTTNPQLELQVERESEYYAAQSQQLTTIVQVIGFSIAGLMAIGATFGAILTMYTAVATRTREIATLRALGFGPPRRTTGGFFAHGDPLPLNDGAPGVRAHATARAIARPHRVRMSCAIHVHWRCDR